MQGEVDRRTTLFRLRHCKWRQPRLRTIRQGIRRARALSGATRRASKHRCFRRRGSGAMFLPLGLPGLSLGPALCQVLRGSTLPVIAGALVEL